MSTMNGNPHYESAALDGIVFSADDAAMQTTELMLDRLAEATLALAFEQRTAAMVGLLATLHPAYNTPGQMSEEGKRKAERIRDDVAARLGLNGDAS